MSNNNNNRDNKWVSLINNFLKREDIRISYNSKIVKGLEIIHTDNYLYTSSGYVQQVLVDTEQLTIAICFVGVSKYETISYASSKKLAAVVNKIMNKFNGLYSKEQRFTNKINYDIKHDKGKPQLTLFPKEAMEAVCEIMEFGANKYGQGTWNRVEAIRYINAAARHLYAMQSKDENGKEYIDLSKVDSESGLEHLYHLACNVVYATALYKRDKEKCEK